MDHLLIYVWLIVVLQSFNTFEQTTLDISRSDKRRTRYIVADASFSDSTVCLIKKR